MFEEEADLQILNGRWGPYIKFQKKNYKIPKDQNAEELSYEQCLELIKADDSKKKTGSKAKTTAKKAAGKKTTDKKAATKKPAAKKTKSTKKTTK